MSTAGVVAALALALGHATPSLSAIAPEPLRANSDLPAMYADGCQQNMVSAEVLSCRYGAADATTTVALFGDSKMAQWFPALQEIAARQGWRIVTYTKSSCLPADVLAVVNAKPYPACRQWVRKVLKKLTRTEKPDLVITTHRHSTAGVGTIERQSATARDGLVATWSRLHDAGVGVIVLADNPSPPRELTVWRCVAANRPYLSACAFDRAAGVAFSAAPIQRASIEQVAAQRWTGNSSRRMSREPLGVGYVDLLDAICPRPRCDPVIGGSLVYREGSHLTATFVRALVPQLEAALIAAGAPGLAGRS